MNSITGLLLKWWSEALLTANTYIYRGKQTFNDTKLTNMLNKLTSYVVNVSTQLTYQNTVLNPQTKHY